MLQVNIAYIAALGLPHLEKIVRHLLGQPLKVLKVVLKRPLLLVKLVNILANPIYQFHVGKCGHDFRYLIDIALLLADKLRILAIVLE